MTDDERCKDCEYYNSEEDYCEALECNGLGCPELPCERNET